MCNFLITQETLQATPDEAVHQNRESARPCKVHRMSESGGLASQVAHHMAHNQGLARATAPKFLPALSIQTVAPRDRSAVSK